jgi:diadenosine tetraphosphate (Ap4A) HIT family hydrolase
MDSVTDPGCMICQKHLGVAPPGWVGPVIYADDLVSVSHRAAGALGYVYVESRRHVPYLDQLSDAEAAAVGWAVARVARGLRAELDVEFIHAFVSGRGVAHLHQHVFARHTGTPRDHPWWPDWEDAPHGDIPALADRLSVYFQDRAS